MKLLMDTHVLLWLAGDSKNLSTKAVDLNFRYAKFFSNVKTMTSNFWKLS